MFLFSLPFIPFMYLIIQIYFIVMAKIKPQLFIEQNMHYEKRQFKFSEETVLDKIINCFFYILKIIYMLFFIGTLVFIFDLNLKIPFSAAEAFSSIIDAEFTCLIGIFSFVAIYTNFKQNSFGLLTVEELLEKKHYTFWLWLFFLLSFSSIIVYSIDNKSHIGSIIGFTLSLSSFIPIAFIMATSIPFLISKQKIIHKQNMNLYLQSYYSEMYQKSFWKILKKNQVFSSFQELVWEYLQESRQIGNIKNVQYVEINADKSLASEFSKKSSRLILLFIVSMMIVTFFIACILGLQENFVSIIMISLILLVIMILLNLNKSVKIGNVRLIYGNWGFEFANKKEKRCFVSLSSMFLIEPLMKKHIKTSLGILVLYINILIFRKEKDIEYILNGVMNICETIDLQNGHYKTIPIVVLLHFFKDMKYQKSKKYCEYFSDSDSKEVTEELKVNASFCTALLKKLECNPQHESFIKDHLNNKNMLEDFYNYVGLEIKKTTSDGSLSSFPDCLL
ncbi:hypothetical protein SAMN04515624_1477 [Eubacterium maltosivorans]|uniref:Uncharacterized protein n=1 Tax=Eubacterium maltosivorans TaxID=2041044 RepID=A0A4P9CAX9_EUBML|nr:hypothetical protein [Eubacterium maltosivorans]QCT72744.1 hypothetical protein CPZ25_015895 [Eubacterium maltosivorans]WPK81653.1 hypothetical protein EUMA32_31090 [Eubacterium maltosivorans]SDP87024.1 hypothetical protein SAMN04515624_1477 [Eubacterium maltosivorans]